MSNRLTAARVVETDDTQRPVQVQMNWDRTDGRDYNATLVQLWELHADIGELLARHPAPQLPARGA